MNENISRLMDGEVDACEVDALCAGFKRPDAVATWTCYHVIGDTLRGSGVMREGFAGRFAARFASEPTVLAPPQRARTDAAGWAWAAAATVAAMTVVGWTAMSLVGEPPAAVAKAGEATAVNAARVRPSAVPTDYLLAHQEYSPSAAIQSAGPYLRAVASPSGDRP